MSEINRPGERFREADTNLDNALAALTGIGRSISDLRGNELFLTERESDLTGNVSRIPKNQAELFTDRVIDGEYAALFGISCIEGYYFNPDHTEGFTETLASASEYFDRAVRFYNEATGLSKLTYDQRF